MRTFLKCSLPSLAAVLTLAACGGSSSGPTTSSPAAGGTPVSAALISSASNPAVGARILTNSAGLTLYRLSGEQQGKFICTSSACLQVWHPVLVSGSSAPTGAVGSLGTVKRPDGTEQVTYRGMPLYTFASDHRAGEVNGEGLHDVGTWDAVTVAAGGGTSTSSEAQSSEPASEGSSGGSPAAPESHAKGGYGY